MSIEKDLELRAAGKCELCEAQTQLAPYWLPPSMEESIDNGILICSHCRQQLQNTDQLDPNHWRCLNNTMWSEHVPVQIMAYRILKYLGQEGWAQDLGGQIYLSEEDLQRAELVFADLDQTQIKDSNGSLLCEGDTVTLIKDLNVKGGGFTAKRGTVVRGIRLTEDPKYIEGKINGQMIVIVAAFTKKV
jgi:protein PhnA